MLSVLIPVYNWDITTLVKEIHDQCADLDIEFEIIAFDDFSPDLSLRKINSELVLPHFKFIQSDKNLGNGQARNQLSSFSKYRWNLFLDADVKPANSNFIKYYISLLENPNENMVFCGGLQYLDESKNDGELRWKYGVKLEVQSPDEAQKEPYLNFKSCNFLIARSVIQKSPFVRMGEIYGFDDTSFALALEKIDVKVTYVNNPVYHLGLESNDIFLEKQKSNVKNAFWMIKNRPEIAEKLRIIRVYEKIKYFRWKGLSRLIFKLTEPVLLKNLLSKNPSIFLLQVYKLGYLCTLKTE